MTYTRGRRKFAGIEIRDPSSDPPSRSAQGAPIDHRRCSMYSSKLCVDERAVGMANLIEQVPGFQALFESGNLQAICDFS